MEPVRILGIAPYPAIAELMQSAAKKRADVALTAFVGDLSAGAQLARQHAGEGYDVILSRGGTAEVIRQAVDVPVIEIELSVYDILRSLKLAQTRNGRCAVIGFPSITENARFLCDVLQYKIDIFTIHDQTEVHAALRALSGQGNAMVLCDVVTTVIAQEYNIPTMLITSGSESVSAALDLAVQKTMILREARAQTELYHSVLEALPERTYVFDEQDKLSYASDGQPLPNFVRKKIPNGPLELCRKTREKVLEDDKGCLYTLRCRTVPCGEGRCAVLSLSEPWQVHSLGRQGIRFWDHAEASAEFFRSYYAVAYPSSPNSTIAEQYAQSERPVLIYGEQGTGKDQMARLLYTKGHYADAPLIELDCSLLGSRGWKYLMENDRSPLTQTGRTLCFRKMSGLSDAQFDELISTLQALRVGQRNKLLFSTPLAPDGSLSTRMRRLLDEMSCLGLLMPTLRTRTEDISALAGLYISSLNMRMAKSVIGFGEGGLRALEGFSWPGNYAQFERVLSDLVQTSTSDYISLACVQRQLTQEHALYGFASVPNALDLDRSLDEINLDILRQVLAQENGNQTKAAKRLGISRTTFWRMLNRE